MPDLIVINDANFEQFVEDPIVDGVRRKRGGVPRNYATHPVGCSALAPTFDFPLLSDADIQAAIKRKDAEKSWLSDVRDRGMFGGQIPSRDQDGRGYSHTADTEVLTEKGWIKWPDYDGSLMLASVNPLTHRMEFQAPTERHGYEYIDEMFYSTNRRLDFGVTRNHRMLVRKWDESRRTLTDSYSFQRADQLGWYVGMMHAPAGFLGVDLERLSIEGDREYLGDDFVALMALLCSDGFAGGSPNTMGLVSFCCFDEDRRNMVANLAARTGFKEQPNRRGVWNRWGAHALASWARANCYFHPDLQAHNKRMPDLMRSVSMRQVKHFLEFFGDKNHVGKPVFYSASKRMMDDVQELHLRIGKRSTLTSRGPRQAITKDGKIINSRESWSLVVGEADRLCIDRKKHLETDKYKGLVYCATVPNGTLITRRNGSVLISGNCWAHSGTSAHLLERAMMNAPYADLSAYAIACIIKGYRDEGGWGLEGVEWQAQHGCPTSKTWPQQGTKRSYETPEMYAEAALHKVVGAWRDMKPNDDRALATCLIMNCPVVVDYDWWSHSVCAARLVSWNPLKILIWNSWGDSWSQAGMGQLEGRKASADGQVALWNVSASAA